MHVAEAAVGHLILPVKQQVFRLLLARAPGSPASGHLALHELEGLHVDDWLVGVFDVVLWQLAVVLPTLLGDWI